MTPASKLTLFIIGVLSLIAITSILTIKLTYIEPVKPTYTAQDSIENIRIDSVKGEYQQVIDSLKKNVQIRYVKVIEYRKVADSLSLNADSICLPVIKAKDRLIAELDSTCAELDNEAQLYSMKLDLTEKQRLIEISRNKALSFQIDSCINLYSDSITAIRKTSDKQLKKEKSKTLFYKVTTTIATALGIYGIISK